MFRNWVTVIRWELKFKITIYRRNIFLNCSVAFLLHATYLGSTIIDDKMFFFLHLQQRSSILSNYAKDVEIWSSQLQSLDLWYTQKRYVPYHRYGKTVFRQGEGEINISKFNVTWFMNSHPWLVLILIGNPKFKF